MKLPDGREIRVTTVDGLAVVLTSNQSATKTWLSGMVELMTNVDEKTIRTEILRGKEKAKGEEYAPLVVALMSKGKMTAESAKVKLSEAKALFYGWTHGKANEIANATGWQVAIDAARMQKAADATTKAAVARRTAVAVIRAELEDKAGDNADLNEIREQAVEELEKQTAQKQAQAALERTETAANKLGFTLFPMTPSPEDLARVCVNANLFKDEVLTAIEQAYQRHDEEVKRKEMEASSIAEGAKAVAAAERGQHRATAIPPVPEVVKA